MKTCMMCKTKFEELRHSCPKCGSSAFSMDMEKSSETMQKQVEAAELVTKGDQFIRAKRYAEAEEILKKAIEINPFNETAYGNLGGVFFFQERWADAIPWLEKALEINPRIEGVGDALKQAKQKAGQSKCFIATACYGSTGSPEVVALQRFRDTVLNAHYWGRMVIRSYYRLSPPLASWLTSHPWAQYICRRVVVDPIVWCVRRNDESRNNAEQG